MGTISKYYGRLSTGYEATIDACAQHYPSRDCVCVWTALSNATTNYCIFFDGKHDKVLIFNGEL
jgi:hypothetical protein